MSEPVYSLSKIQFVLKEYKDKNGHNVLIGSRLRNDYKVKFLVVLVKGMVYLTDDRVDGKLGREYNMEQMKYLTKLRNKK